MILKLLITLFFGLITLLLNIIPTIQLPEGWSSFLDDLNYVVSLGAFFLPMPTIIACLTIVFVVDNIKLLMSIFNWIISKIPTIS